jgi:hypothetical protein
MLAATGNAVPSSLPSDQTVVTGYVTVWTPRRHAILADFTKAAHCGRDTIEKIASDQFDAGHHQKRRRIFTKHIPKAHSSQS